MHWHLYYAMNLNDRLFATSVCDCFSSWECLHFHFCKLFSPQDPDFLCLSETGCNLQVTIIDFYCEQITTPLASVEYFCWKPALYITTKPLLMSLCNFRDFFPFFNLLLSSNFLGFMVVSLAGGLTYFMSFEKQPGWWYSLFLIYST